MATTFLTDPPISTPIGSEFVYKRKLDPEKALWTWLAASLSVEATTSAVGSPAATSLAKVGPESTEVLGGNRVPVSWRVTSGMRRSEPVFRPFVALPSSIEG